MMRPCISPCLLFALGVFGGKPDGEGACFGSEAACLSRAEQSSDSSDPLVLLQSGLRTSTADTSEPFRQEILESDLVLPHGDQGIGLHHRLPPSVMQQSGPPATAPVAPAGSSCQVNATRGWPAQMTLSSEQLRRGAVNLNGASRFRALLGKLQSGSSDHILRIMVIGGSVEKKDSIVNYEQKWPSLVARWLSDSSNSSAKHVVDYFEMQDEAIQLSSPTSFTLDATWKKMLNSIASYDIVFVAGSVNSPLRPKPGFVNGPYSFVKEASVRKSLDEVVIRALLDHPKSPAVMLVEWLYHGDWWSDSKHKLHGADPRAYIGMNGLEWKYSTWEDESYSFLAMYYEISMVSGRSALLHSSEIESTSDTSLGPRFNSSDLFLDGLHPTILGHALLSQVVQFAICEQFHLLKESSSARLAQPSENYSRLPNAVFENPANQLAMRHGADLSGFSHLDEHINISTTTSISRNASNTSTLDWELRVTVLPLLLLESCAFFGVNQGAVLTSSSATPALHTFSVEPFRFLGVFHIVLMHEAMSRKEDLWWGTAASFGKYWVQFFYALSGLVLYISQGAAPDVADSSLFIMKRVYGIYLPYVIGIVLALSAAEAPWQAAWNYLSQNILPGFLLVDSWASPYGVQSPNGPAWFVCTLFAFWLCFPHWYRFLHGVRSPALVMLLAYMSTFGLPVLYAALNVEHRCHPSLCAVWGPFAEFHPLSNWQVFVFGMCIGRMLQDTNPDAVPSGLKKVAATCALLMLFSLPSFSPMPSGSVLTLFLDKGPLLLPVFAVILYFLPLGDDILLRPWFLESAFLAYLGAVSGHLFLLHYPVRLLLARLSPSGTSVFTTVLLQLLVAIAFYEVQKRYVGSLRLAKPVNSV